MGLLYGLLQAAAVGVHLPLAWDESVYASQVRGGPRLLWTAPRARGVPALLWPVVHLTSSTAAMRGYLIVLTSVGLVLAYRPWLALRPGRAVPLAALCFATVWVTVFYGPAAMPNLYVALCAVAASGYFVRAGREAPARFPAAAPPGRLLLAAPPARRLLSAPLAGLLASLALMSLVRPTDSLYLALPMVVAAAATRSARTRRLATVIAGVAVGWAVWSAEAVVAWGGPLARLRAARLEDAGSSWHANLLLYARTLGGPLECCAPQWHAAWQHPLPALLWWLALVPLVASGIAVAGRLRGAYLLALAMAAALAVQYVFTLSVVGVRHPLPVYALLALPVGEAVCRLAARPRPVLRAAVVALLVLGMAGHVAIQLRILKAVVDGSRRGGARYQAVAHELNRLGVRAPCAVAGTSGPPIAYAAGCGQLLYFPTAHSRSYATTLIGASTMRHTPVLPAALRTPGLHVAVVLDGAPGTRYPYLAGWQRHDVRTPAPHWRIYTPPGRATSGELTPPAG